MTDDKNTIRSKLTLKMKPLGLEPKVATSTATTFEPKKHSSAVQVTIKGRKRDVRPSNEHSSALNNAEVAARFKAVSGSKTTNASETKDHKVFSKLSLEKHKAEAAVATPIEEEIELVIEEQIEEISEPVEIIEEPIQQKSPTVATPYKHDAFDVRNKIRQSIEITNRQKEEREKIVDERKKLEQERVAKELAHKESLKKVNNFKSPAAKPAGKYTTSEEEARKKPHFKEERVNVRKLTYIIGDDSADSDGSSRYRKRGRNQRNQVQDQNQKEYKKVAREVLLPDLISVSDLADRMTEKTGDVVKKLFSMGTVATSNQVIDADTAEIIIAEFGHTSKRVSHSDVENVLEDTGPDSATASLPRAPIVTIMGHVDHGKTSLLDALRTTDVVSGEHGGITQHIGASRIKTTGGKYITFLDTPGHEAFTEMRSRGANITDIVVLVVAADDGVKEQTIEAISHAKAAGVPIIVAVNKIDKPGSDPERVKHELLSHNIISEDLGGDVMFVPVSAKNKLNLDKLEEVILLQAEMLDLKSPYDGKASGVVLESKVDPAKGATATLLVLKGTLNISDLIVVGTSYGRVRKMSNDKGDNIKSAEPSMAVEVLGLDNVPNAGDKFVQVDEERQAREIISYRARKEKEVKAMKNSAKSIADIFKESNSDTVKIKHLNIIIKSDVNGSAEAINGSVAKINTTEVAVKVVHMATGGITESDINLAAVSNAIIVAFNVRATASAKEMARLKNVDIRYYSVIYNLVDDLKLLLSGMLEPSRNEEYLGQAEIRQVFQVSGIGKIAGSFVTDGLIRRNAKVRLLRDNIVIHDGILKTLKRFKDDAKEVKSGFECGVSFENYEDIKEKDVVECYEVIEKKRSL